MQGAPPVSYTHLLAWGSDIERFACQLIDMMFYLIEAVGELLGCFLQGIGVDAYLSLIHI